MEPLDPAAAFDVVRNWGFVAHFSPPGMPGGSWLAIALRPSPTFLHFDPEEIDYWISRGGRGARESIDATTPTPLDTEFSWGTIRAVDRLGIANEWVTCGGRLTADTIGDDVVCLFRSDVPILRRGGHSQGWDHGGASLAAFFGQMKVAVDYVPGFAAASPRVRFAAFVAHLAHRYRAAPALADAHPDVARLVLTEEARLHAVTPCVLAAGAALDAAAGLLGVAAA
jgi:hypothetical protein